MPLPFEYYQIQGGDPEEPGIDGEIGEIKDLTFGDGKHLSVVTVPVVNLNEAIEKVKKSGGIVIEPKTSIPGIGWYATCS